nr:hypothetical protein [Tanacetum cinerariifolium]
MTGNRALLTNFVEKFLGTVRFRNNDFAVIACYGDVVIGSTSIKIVYYVEGKIHRKHHKSKTAFASNKPLYLLHMDLCGLMRVENINGKQYVLVVIDDYSRYTWVFFLHSKDEASEVIISFIKKTQVNIQLQVQRVRTDNGTKFKNKNLAKFFDADVGKLKEKRDIGVFVRYLKESAAFRIYNTRTRKIHESVNVNFDEISEMASKQFSLEPDLTNLNEKGKSSNPTVSQVSKASKKDLDDLFQKFYDEYFDSSKIMKSSTMNVETSNIKIPSNEEEVFHEKEVTVPLSNTQSISNNMVPNADEASTSHNVFNERLKDVYFDACTSFQDSSNVRTFYQPYPQEKKRTKDHPLHKIIGDPKSSASAMQDELDQFARLKVWRLVPRPEGKTIIKTKWIFKIKKDESSLVIRNKPRFVAVGYSQQEGIDYDETFAPVARIRRKFPTLMVEQAKLKLDLVGKPVGHTDYQSMIRLLMYVTSSRPDIMFTTCADHAGCHLERKSTSGSVQFLGDKLVCWSSKKHNCVSISIAKSKYVAVSSCCAQVLWMRTQLTDYGFFYDKVPIYYDSKSAIAISCNPV